MISSLNLNYLTGYSRKHTSRVHTYVSVYVVYEQPTTTDVAFTNHNLVSSSST